MCSIENLSNLEEKNGFEEKAKKSEKFFRKGSIDEWKIKLTKDQIKKIEENFKAEMIELKYL